MLPPASRTSTPVRADLCPVSCSPRDFGSLRSEEHTSELQSHSDLPSFPTRRSSDLSIWIFSRLQKLLDSLPIPLGSFLMDARSFSLVETFRDLTPCCLQRVEHPLLFARISVRSHVVPETSDRLDRKSTRLNSSHTVIYPLSLHDALPISRFGSSPDSRSCLTRCQSPLAASSWMLGVSPSSRRFVT